FTFHAPTMPPQNPFVSIGASVEQHTANQVSGSGIEILRHFRQPLYDGIAQACPLQNSRFIQNLDRRKATIAINDSIASTLFRLVENVERISGIKPMIHYTTRHSSGMIGI